ncbi:MAG: M23 family metallopeptidase [Anaerolineales bacterium]|nr:M23 family metallopeptidase [Anaerolineales bacterium]
MTDNPEIHPLPGNDIEFSAEGLPKTKPIVEEEVPQDPLYNLWELLTRIGLANASLRLATLIILGVLIVVIIWVMGQLYVINPMQFQGGSGLGMAIATATPIPDVPVLSLINAGEIDPVGITRYVQAHTTIPSRPRYDVITYTVQTGDTLFDIADRFGLKPETLLWGNQLVLADNPHNLRPGQELAILPVDGTYYRWQAGDGLNTVARFFGVTPETIINWPGNQLDPTQLGDYAHPNIEAGLWLVVPGGTREFVTWSAPEIPLDNPGVAKVLGPGACENVAIGSVGNGVFIWPANNHFLSGYDYSPSTNHYGIDIDGETGDPIYAADTGVVVYSGWNNWGYGNVVVINHGNSWQTLYAHLNAINVGCGQSVIQGGVIGAMGETGNASGSHLHFEMMYKGTKVNPWNYLP